MKSFFSLVQNAYGGLSRSVWLLALTQLINRSGTMVVFFLSVYLKDELQFSLTDVGIIMAMFGMGSLLGVFIGGRVADKIGYYPVMLVSLFGGGLMFIMVGQLHSFWPLCIGMFVLSALGEAFRPVGMVAISYYSTKENYTRSISLYRLALNLGFAIGPAVGGILARKDYSLIFWADGITNIASAILVLLFLQNKHHSSVKPELETLNQPFVVQKAYRDRAYLFFLPLVTIYAMVFFQFFSTMSLYYKSAEHLSEDQIGLLLGLNGLLVATIEMIMIYKIQHKGTVYNWIFLGCLLVFIAYVMLLFVHGFYWLIVITVVISFSEMFAMPFMNTFMNQRASASNKGQYASLYVMAWSVATILIPILSTQVMYRFGYETLWAILAGMSLLVMIGVRLLERYVKAQ